MSIDNSNLAQKIDIRQRGLKLLGSQPSLIVDMFAGEGTISRLLWSRLGATLTCIDKQQDKLDKIDFECEKICGDNFDHIGLTKNADIVDLDAYGNVFELLKEVVLASEKTKIVFFTESNPMAKNKDKYFMQFFYALNQLKKVGCYQVFEKLNYAGDAFGLERPNVNNSGVLYGFVYVF